MLTYKERNQLAKQCYQERNNGGFASSFDDLIKIYQTELYNYVQSYFTLSDQNTKEIIQLTSIKIWEIFTHRNGKRYKEQNNFDWWAKRLTYNIAIDYFRQKKRSKTVSFDSTINNNEIKGTYRELLQHTEKSPEEKIIQQEDIKKVNELIKKLPEEQAEVIRLRMFGELSFKEIAKETGVSINTSLGRMRYALINLRNILKI